MAFRVTGLDPSVLRLQCKDLDFRSAVVQTHPGSPCRVTLEDAAVGETVWLFSYEHQPARTPFRQAGPIFVRPHATRPFSAVGIVPQALRIRPLSLRAYDAEGMMIDAALCDGATAADAIERLFAAPAVCVLHAHFALRGCFAAAIERV